ncbi:MAG: hypothetical protein AAGC55_00500 [Myxococcota bacterium]
MTNHTSTRTSTATIGLAMAFAMTACASSTISDTSNKRSKAPSINNVSGQFTGPESAVWDPDAEVWYMASFGQNFDLSGETPDRPGYITRLDASGKILDKRFIELSGDVLGMAIMDGVLYASHASDLLAVDLDTRAVKTIAIPGGAGFLNDVAAGNGEVYVSDTGKNAIYRYIPGGEPEVFSTDPALAAPNGVYVDDDKVVVVTLGAFPPNPETPGGVFTLDSDGEATRVGKLAGLFDGIAKAGKRYLVSDIRGQLHFLSATSGKSKMIVDASIAPHGLASTADFGFDAATGTLLIPDLLGNKAYFYRLP